MEFERVPEATSATEPRRVIRTGEGLPARIAVIDGQIVESTQAENATELLVLGLNTDRFGKKGLVLLSIPLPTVDARLALLQDAGLGTQSQFAMALSRGMQLAWNDLPQQTRAEMKRIQGEVLAYEPTVENFMQFIEAGKTGCKDLQGFES